MAVPEIALITRARGLGRHLLARATLEALAEADDLPAFARGLSRLGAAIDPIGEAPDVFEIDRAVGRTAARYFRTLHRWQERTPGVLDVFAADHDRRSLRALLRGAAQGAPSAARSRGLIPTPLLPQRALTELARQASPAAVVGQLVLLGHPHATRLLPLVQETQPDLFALDVALLQGFAASASAAAKTGDRTLREFVRDHIDVGNAQNALLFAGGPRDVEAAHSFVEGGRWLSRTGFESAAAAVSQQAALMTLRTALAKSPLASALPVVAGDVAHLDRAFLSASLEGLAHATRVEPVSTAPLLRVLLRIESQSHDLRTLAWGAALGTPPALRKQQLVTPS
jgi:vacuolar-type H+-ATPase subunit C/Vma6